MRFPACVSFSGEGGRSCLASPSTHAERYSKLAVILNTLPKGFPLHPPLPLRLPRLCLLQSQGWEFSPQGNFQSVTSVTSFKTERNLRLLTRI